MTLLYIHTLHVHTARSPIYSHVSTTLQGLPIIRTFQKQDIAQRLLYHHQDVHSEVRDAILTYTCSLHVLLYRIYQDYAHVQIYVHLFFWKVLQEYAHQKNILSVSCQEKV